MLGTGSARHRVVRFTEEEVKETLSERYPVEILNRQRDGMDWISICEQSRSYYQPQFYYRGDSESEFCLIPGQVTDQRQMNR